MWALVFGVNANIGVLKNNARFFLERQFFGKANAGIDTKWEQIIKVQCGTVRCNNLSFLLFLLICFVFNLILSKSTLIKGKSLPTFLSIYYEHKTSDHKRHTDHGIAFLLEPNNLVWGGGPPSTHALPYLPTPCELTNKVKTLHLLHHLECGG